MVKRQSVNDDKWYRRWWSWSPAMVIEYKADRRSEARLRSLADNRAVVGFYRYELPRFGRPTKPNGRDWNLAGKAIEKLSAYQRTGNREMLVDAYNYIKWEFARPGHTNAHFKSEDQGCE